MFLKSKFFRVVCALTLLLALFSLVFADTIRLKDGSIIKGKIINFSNGQFTILIGEGSRQRRMNFFADEIDSIEFDSTQTPIATINSNSQLPQKSNNSNSNTNTNNSNSNTTVITVGQNTKPTPTPIPTPTPTVSNTNNEGDIVITAPTNTNQNTRTNPTNTTNSPKPIELKVKVLADNTANGWTNSGWVVRKGQKIKITAKGNISLGGGNYSTPSGKSNLADKDRLMQQEPTGGLIAVIGDDNNDFIFIGTNREFTAQRDGSLFLGVNETNLEDNSGSFEVTIEILP